MQITALLHQLTPTSLIISMSDLPPEKRLRMTELKMTETESPVLSADELNRFSRQNAALGTVIVNATFTTLSALKVWASILSQLFQSHDLNHRC